MHYDENPQLQLAYNFLQYTNKNVYLTGKAGTGKTTFLRKLRNVSPKRMVVVAPTGVAAINAGGVTIHSFFQLSFGPQIPFDPNRPNEETVDDKNASIAAKRFSKEKINIIRSLDLLVIDEISMVRADVLDGIDGVLRRFKDRYKPFGGVQLLMIGDLQQLAPIVKEEEWGVLRNYYDTCFFFSSRALKQSDFVGIELKHIYRQSDHVFINLLNKVRENKMDQAAVQQLNQRYKAGFIPADDEGYITLTTHNSQSHRINDSKLNQLKSASQFYKAVVEGDFPEYSYPTDSVLVLKIGAQVMFVKNDPSYEKLYYNGKIGTVVNLNDVGAEIQCKDDANTIWVGSAEWENSKYSLNDETQEIEEKVVGKFTQLPLKLAWAITIHKSQGLTFDKAIIDARQSFAHGQVYVALSRCRSLEGLVLSTPIEARSVINDTTVVGFSEKVEKNQPDEAVLLKSKINFELQLITGLFDFVPFVRTVQYFLRIWNENAPVLLGNLNSILINMLAPVNAEIVEISNRFYTQLHQLVKQEKSVEESDVLQDRVKKASTYFLDKMTALIETPISESNFQTDNKTIRKRLSNIFARIELDLNIKRECMEHIIANGFQVKPFLEVKGKAAIEKTAKRSKSKVAAVSTAYPDFYAKLVQWRDDKADELGVEVSKILRQKVLVEISDLLPVTAKELKAVRGMGGTKMQQIGKNVLSLILQYRKDNDLPLPLDAQKEVEFAGLDTKEISLAMFNNGKSIKEIAKERQFAVTTIEGHLAYFVSSGELDIFRVVDEDIYSEIAKVIKDSDVTSLSEARFKLGDRYSYAQIKMVMAHLGW